MMHNSGDEFGPAIYVFQPSRGLAYAGIGLLVLAVAILLFGDLEIGGFPLRLLTILAIILVPVGLGFLFQMFKTPYKVGTEGFAIYKWGKWRVYSWRDLTAIWVTTTHSVRC